MRVLYLSYDGLLEPIGQSQILPYLEGLSQRGFRFWLSTFEKPAAASPGSAALEGTRSRLKSAGIRWHPLRYHKRPPLLSTIYDAARGMMWALWLAARHQVQLVHVRSYVPAVMALPVRRLLRRPILFDIRGFWVDERVEGGIWGRGALYRGAKRVEVLLYRNADGVVTLTEEARGRIAGMLASRARPPRIVVIPTCVDTEKFTLGEPDESLRGRLALGNKSVFCYLGSLGTWYAVDETITFFRAVREMMAETGFLFLVKGSRGDLECLRTLLEQAGLEKVSRVVAGLPHDEIPAWLSLVAVGVAFIRPTQSKLASFPTKIGEYLASGLPVVVSGGLVDCERLVEAERVGVVVGEFTAEGHRRALLSLLTLCQDPSLRQRCRQAALQHLSLAEGVARYEALYRDLSRAGRDSSKEGGS